MRNCFEKFFRLQHERAGARDPALWVGHLAEALAGGRRGGEAEGSALLGRFRAIPAFLHSAEASLTEPSEPMVDLACELIDPVADLITRRLAEHADDRELYPPLKEAGTSAESALARFRLALDTELRELSVTHTPGVGETQFERLLHHGHAVRGGAPELWRQFLRLEEETLEGMHRLARDLDGDWRGLLEERLEGAEQEMDPGTEALRELRRIQAFLAGRDILPGETGELSLDPVPGWLAPSTCLSIQRRFPSADRERAPSTSGRSQVGNQPPHGGPPEWLRGGGPVLDTTSPGGGPGRGEVCSKRRASYGARNGCTNEE